MSDEDRKRLIREALHGAKVSPGEAEAPKQAPAPVAPAPFSPMGQQIQQQYQEYLKQQVQFPKTWGYGTTANQLGAIYQPSNFTILYGTAGTASATAAAPSFLSSYIQSS